MKAVILCAGLGSRMGKQTKDCPKPLLKVNNLTIIDENFSDNNYIVLIHLKNNLRLGCCKGL